MRNQMTLIAIVGLIGFFSSSATGQQGPSRREIERDSSFFLQNKSVQVELKLTKEQLAKIIPKIVELNDKRLKILKQAFDGGLKKEEFEKIEVEAKKLQTAFESFVSDTLQKEQMTRLNQIHRQSAGAMIFLNDDEVAKTLKLADEQKSKMMIIQDEQQKQMEQALTDIRKDYEAGLKKMKALPKEGLQKARAILDMDQKAKLDKLLGAEFEMKWEEPKKAKPKDANSPK